MKKLKQLPNNLKELQENYSNHDFYEFEPRETLPKGHTILGLIGRYTYTAKKKKSKKQKREKQNEQSQNG